MLNKVFLIGRITNDIELKSSNTTDYVYFNLAVNRQSKDKKADFISCTAFGETAKLMDKYLAKGSLISVEGRLEVFINDKKEKRTNVIVNNVVFLDSKNKSNDEVDNSNDMDFENFEINI